jgi:phosphoglycerate dehydrogenase-like enzyme
LRQNVLLTARNLGDDNIERLSRLANVYAAWKMDERSLEEILPEIDVLVVFLWPRFLTPEKLVKMKRLRFLQSVLVGVNHVPFAGLRDDVIVASNAGAYSLEVAEHAWALLLTAAKRVVEQHQRIRGGSKSLTDFAGEAAGMVVLKGKTLGIVGYGGIGREIARFGKAFGMNIVAYGRRSARQRGVTILSGKSGLDSLLKQSDVVILSLPLTSSTNRMMGERELSLLKDNAVLVNIARGDLIDQNALYSHLKSRPNLRYATDVWWYREGQETLETDLPLAALSNFVGTPHMSGPTGTLSGRPGKSAADNVLRYLKKRAPRHVIDRREYVEAG